MGEIAGCRLKTAVFERLPRDCKVAAAVWWTSSRNAWIEARSSPAGLAPRVSRSPAGAPRCGYFLASPSSSLFRFQYDGIIGFSKFRDKRARRLVARPDLVTADFAHHMT